MSFEQNVWTPYQTWWRGLLGTIWTFQFRFILRCSFQRITLNHSNVITSLIHIFASSIWTIQHLDFELFPSDIIFIYSASKMREHTIQLLNVLSPVYQLADCNFQWHERLQINVLNWTEAKKSIKEHLFIHHRNALACNMIHKDTISFWIIEWFYRMEFLSYFRRISNQIFPSSKFAYNSQSWRRFIARHIGCPSQPNSHCVLESELFSNQSQDKNIDFFSSLNVSLQMCSCIQFFKYNFGILTQSIHVGLTVQLYLANCIMHMFTSYIVKL